MNIRNLGVGTPLAGIQAGLHGLGDVGAGRTRAGYFHDGSLRWNTEPCAAARRHVTIC
jgi:hypothetical protein